MALQITTGSSFQPWQRRDQRLSTVRYATTTKKVQNWTCRTGVQATVLRFAPRQRTTAPRMEVYPDVHVEIQAAIINSLHDSRERNMELDSRRITCCLWVVKGLIPRGSALGPSVGSKTRRF